MGEWLEKRMDDIAEFNPRESIKKGAIAKKIAMDKLQPFCRDVSRFEMEPFSGGTKFRNGDILMARITPCLENGKTARVDVLDEDEVGFGSTEYIVLRAKERNDPDFTYYLVTSSLVREPAIKSMVGSSGRQRIQTDVLQKLKVKVPDLKSQQAIAGILKSLDDKIAANRRVNENLEEQVSLLYVAQFEEFIPHDGVHPSSWKQGILADIASITSGKRPPMKSADRTDVATIPLVGAASVMGFTSDFNHKDKILVTGRVGTHGVVQRFNSPCWTSDNTLVITSDFYEYVYQVLQRIDYHSLNRGSTQPLITQGDMNKVVVLIPDAESLHNFESTAGQLMELYEVNLSENRRLAELRDTLLPRLMSGELDVSDLDL
ncbi:restriction endonuclease subunit S [Pyramidobacter porci]|uniref:restriction endonuclease subunit S n=1 Tax=Pyramidobacter porci TaxID=2605789 RepID=UPI001E6101A2|nr:restriction endonuclease subunit S [Pyramidobacter porci]